MKTTLFRCIILAAILFGCASTTHRDGEKKDFRALFPFPEFEKDFAVIVGAAHEYSKIHGKGDKIFKNLTLSYAPLDLHQPGKAKKEDFHAYRNFTFAYLSKVFEADSDARSKEFFCDNKCWGARTKFALSSVRKLRGLVGKFREARRLWLVGHWNMEGQFRINNWFYSGSKYFAGVPSTDLQILSSGVLEPLTGLGQESSPDIKGVGESLVKELKDLGFISLIREDDNDSVTVVADGFADNIWGVVFLSEKQKGTIHNSDTFKLLEEDVGMFRLGGERHFFQEI